LQVDLAVFDILGRNSAGMVGLPVREQYSDLFDPIIPSRRDNQVYEDEEFAEETPLSPSLDSRRRSWPTPSAASTNPDQSFVSAPPAKTSRIVMSMSSIHAQANTPSTRQEYGEDIDDSPIVRPVVPQSQSIVSTSINFRASSKEAGSEKRRSNSRLSSSGVVSRQSDTEYDEEKKRALKLQNELAEVQIAYLKLKMEKLKIEMAKSGNENE
jgi:hypothetical protein